VHDAVAVQEGACLRDLERRLQHRARAQPAGGALPQQAARDGVLRAARSAL